MASGKTTYAKSLIKTKWIYGDDKTVRLLRLYKDRKMASGKTTYAKSLIKTKWIYGMKIERMKMNEIL